MIRTGARRRSLPQNLCRNRRRVGRIYVACEAKMTQRESAAPEASGNWMRRNERTIALIVAVVTISWGVHEYLRQQWNGRVERSLGIYERYQSDQVMRARVAIDRLWNSSTMWEQLKQRQDKDGRLKFESMSDLALSATKDPVVVENLFFVWNVMREASLCLAQKQCDQYTICKAFWAEAQKTFYFFRPYFVERNIAWDETIQDPERYAWELLDNRCGSGNIICLFETASYSSVKRYLYETFNVWDTGTSKCVPTNGSVDSPSETENSGRIFDNSRAHSNSFAVAEHALVGTL